MAERADMIRRAHRGEQTEADLKAELVMSAEVVDLLQRRYPHRYGGATGRALLDYERLHVEAGRLLREAEDYHCPKRVAVLEDVADTLDTVALPEEFFRRLMKARKRIRALGRRRARTLERDQSIRFWWRACWRNPIWRERRAKRTGKALSYVEAIKALAHEYGRSEKAIEAVISVPDTNPVGDQRQRDFERVQAAIKKRFPSRSGIAD